MEELAKPNTSIVIKFGEKENLRMLQQGDLYVCPLRKYVEDEKLQYGISDENEGVSKCGTVKYKVNLDYPIFCLYRPDYGTSKGVNTITYVKDIFNMYSHALVIDANKLYEKISESCGKEYTFAYHDVVYGKCSKLIKAPFQKNTEFKEQNEIRYVFLDLRKYLGKDINGVDKYGAPIISANGEVFLKLGDLNSISKLVRKEELEGMEFYID